MQIIKWLKRFQVWGALCFSFDQINKPIKFIWWLLHLPSYPIAFFVFRLITPGSGILPPLTSLPLAQTQRHTHTHTHVLSMCCAPIASITFRTRLHRQEREGHLCYLISPLCNNLSQHCLWQHVSQIPVNLFFHQIPSTLHRHFITLP